MITEDYVSYEVARLLEEKGYDEQTRLCFRGDGKILHNDGSYVGYPGYYPRPTLQMARKWLRKEHKLHIWVDYSSFDFNDELPYVWNIRETKIEGAYWGGTYHKSCEEAEEAGIRYCLENLI